MSIYEKNIIREDTGIPLGRVQRSINMPEEREVAQMKFERFCRRLRWILFLIYLPLALSAISLLILIFGYINGTSSFDGTGFQRLLGLFEIFALFCLAAVGLHSVRTVRKPFTQTMACCIFIAGMVVLLFSALMPTLFPFVKSGYDLLSFGRFCIDGLPCTAGVLVLLFSRIYHYGVGLQNSDDLTI